jgi:hypothetical protein
VTIWPESLSEFPFILNDFDNYHWVCLRRDPMSQMLSWWISSKNYNFDGLRTSKPVTIEEHDMQRMYWNYYTVYELQNWLVNNKSATLISFEDLISGNAKHFGTNYNISTIDEHTNLEALVHNMDEVKEWFNILEGKRSSDIDNFHN